MSPTEPRIGVLPLGKVPEIVSKSIAAHILGYLDLDADILPALDDPSYAFDKRRLQYDAGAILKSLESEPFQDYIKVIGLLDVDIFVPIFTHVFGEAKQGGKCALVSLYRLRKNLDGTIASIPILLERTAKVALHESGHLLNLLHCMDERCVMHFSGTLEDLDNTPLYLCRYCSTYLRDALSRI
ncbi:MAG: archaemetzincin family Zn-dependent metalloprotease [Deltaproteobacteria bacterium]|nr:archaemetzincin family Zn-dependent metalloprotease [Deltaproteobacteria bacterium]MBW1736496.1 archaemetzincin family Zn-dependent metalloprotease [Deltaproteobacteria bacterium]MBW1909589.1 archaemetzincin family Zn-dependent metalloprotease [Deltaproteobacteria bacterium]MBW2033510.1 archaemetzincin family Zn-dependent metalloprotease [Deltaproteobacteria bacterium]MBW2114093.1 archaemetzincin family Zn-dependent metalloprotease [Deltaproteobacteria bacterium]